MRNKGFTLIELLAIIVILAIISVITVPIVLNIIDNSKIGAVKDSAYGYKEAFNKWYLEKLSYDKNYIVSDGTYEISKLKKLGVSVNGREPSDNSWIQINNNSVKDACLQFDEYKVVIVNGEVVDVQKNICLAPDPVSFETDSWATIKRAINEDNTDLYNIGDTKEVEIDLNGDGEIDETESFTVRLSNKTFEGCDTVENGFSQTACGYVFEFVDIIKNFRSDWGSGSTTGWPQSAMYGTSNAIYYKLPIDLQNVIADTYVVSSHRTSQEENYITTDKLYLLSLKEISGISSKNDTAASNTKKLEYYSHPNTTRIKTKVDGTPAGWWTRTAHYSINGFYFYVRPDGNPDNTFYSTAAFRDSDGQGLAPAFRIVKD